jgi:hypothetical protein
MSEPITESKTFDNISVTAGETTTTYYNGQLKVNIDIEDGDYFVTLEAADTLKTTEKDAYTLALRVYPADAEATARINMWSYGSIYFTNILTTEGITWTNGTDDMCVSNETTIPDVISVGAYVTKPSWKNYDNKTYSFKSYIMDDIATFSSYATAEMSPLGVAYPWITAPGAVVVAGVNHFHTTDVDKYSYYGAIELVVNDADNPYATMQGTSMATPVAAGIVALWLQAASEQGKTLTVSQVKEIMRATAINDEYTTTGPNASHFGNGKIDALAGLHAILEMGGEATSLSEELKVQREESASAIEWYTLSGTRLNAQPTKPGLYINSRHQVVIK